MSSVASAVPLAAPDSVVRRRLRITPSMCGQTSLVAGQIGDWAWDTVTRLCGTDVLTATNASGAPTYLAFYYFRIRGDAGLHPGALRFGDTLDVTSKAYNFGSESVLTVHRICKAPDGFGPEEDAFDHEELYERPRPGRLYAETFNRWITRADGKSNEGLIKSSPVGFQYAHLPLLPEAYSPRRAYGDARARGTFHDVDSAEYRRTVDRFPLRYAVDVIRDVNGVGLIYFASYFSVVDWAIWQLAKHQGRGEQTFLSRVVLDQQLCFLGNAALDTTFDIDVQHWARLGGEEELFNVRIREGAQGRDIAVATVKLRFDAASEGGHRG
ncbi:LnmK family bifunctional acyltransferase/decarboxylase [Myxococcus sp. 1LA]